MCLRALVWKSFKDMENITTGFKVKSTTTTVQNLSYLSPYLSQLIFPFQRNKKQSLKSGAALVPDPCFVWGMGHALVFHISYPIVIFTAFG